MKKVKQTWEKDYRPLKLFKNDVEEIINIVQTELSTEAHIEIDEFLLDDVKQLSEIDKDTVYKLFISAGGNVFMMRLGRNSACLHIDDKEDTRLRGVASRVDGILREKQRIFSFIYTRPINWLLSFFLGIFSGALFAIGQQIPIFILLSVAFLIIFLANLTCYKYFTSHFSTIHMCYSSQKPNFFKRNKDAILVAVIASVLSLILGVFGTLFVQWIIKKG